MQARPTVQVVWPKPGKVLIGIMAANVVCYVLQLVLLRAGVGFVGDLYISPAGVFDRLYLWQPFTYMWLHSPRDPFHLLMNLIMLWWFGTKLERWWGPKRFLTAYVIFGLGGAALTLLTGLMAQTALLGPLFPGFWQGSHLGASGAVLGIVVAFGVVFANEQLHLLFLGAVKARTLVLIIVAVNLLMALSFSPVSTTSHFGGMIAAYIVCRGLWRPAKWKELGRRFGLARRRRKTERELRILEGGRGRQDDPRNWN